MDQGRQDWGDLFFVAKKRIRSSEKLRMTLSRKFWSLAISRRTPNKMTADLKIETTQPSSHRKYLLQIPKPHVSVILTLSDGI
jgi:hypothetical protein